MTTPKAIETKYKGYRFRSRTEARWAVFFDHLGVEWEFETQGFDLGGDLGRYLPDFYLPASKTFVEIKPGNDAPTRSIYMAGKVEQNCWRGDITLGLRSAGLNSDERLDWPRFLIPGTRLEYVGPYFVSCDHGCSHGDMTHGQGPGCSDTAPAAKDLSRACLSAVRDADWIFCWINQLDCYATLIELGYAARDGRKIFVGVDEKLKDQLRHREIPPPVGDEPAPRHVGAHELWFLESLSSEFGFFADAKAAFRTLLPDTMPIEEKKVAAVAKATQRKYSLVYGQPGNHEVFGEKLRNVMRPHTWESWRVYRDGYDAAVAAARGARFEHGENG